MEEDLKELRLNTDSIDMVFDCIVPYIHDGRDRNSVSLVCRKWFELESMTRKHVTVPICYSITPFRLLQRFPYLESLTVKGKPRVVMPRATMFESVQEDWGAYATPWVHEIANSSSCLKAVHFRRMIVRDSDLELLARTRGKQLRVLKIDACSGFSTDGLLHIGKYCNHLKTLYLHRSKIVEKDGEWLHELALRSTAMESLNYYNTSLFKCDYKDLALLAKNCSKSLVSLKITECDLVDLGDIFNYAVKLEEFGGAPFYDPDEHVSVTFPLKLRCMAMDYMSKTDIPVVLCFSHQLTELDLTCARFGKDDYCFMFYTCPNLEVLYARDAIRDIGLQFVGHCCKKLRKIKIEKGASEDGLLSHIGLIALAEGCLKLECLHVNVKDITNEALKCIGSNLKNLYDFRLFVHNKQQEATDLALDNGVRDMLIGCTKLERLGIYGRPGLLTDAGLGYIGRYGQNLRSLLLGFLVEQDEGLVELSKGCPNLQKFEMRGQFLSEHALAAFVLNLTSLRYLWVQVYCICDIGSDVSESGGDISESGGYISECSSDISESDGENFRGGGAIFGGGGDILAMARPLWNMELINCGIDVDDEPWPGSSFHLQAYSFLAYYSLAGQRTDFPDTVTPLHPPLRH